ncbi:MAG: hypothetical protein JRD93_02950 [Deltaproteobacteria bacterium]|nr:hypothetical protein [Deltaproteobacteria bacterium]MBW2660955.1 hypothetical protein [Deltaproteobacteria bacterium]
MKSHDNDLDNKNSRLPDESPEMDAWLTTFFIENHLDYYAYQDHVSSPEQIRFIVYTEGEERYYPCSDRMFEAIMNKNKSAFMQKKYNEVLQKILNLINEKIEDEKEKAYLESLIITKYKHETRDEIMIPSRLKKRLLGIFLNRTQIEDPCICDKNLRNSRADKALSSEAFTTSMNHADTSNIKTLSATLSGIRKIVHHLELKRLFSLSVEKSLWESDKAAGYSKDDYLSFFNRGFSGNGLEPLLHFLEMEENKKSGHKRILWLADEAGEIIVDFAIIKYLAKLGHKIIIAFKEGPLFTKIDFSDAVGNEILSSYLEEALIIHEKNLGKNELAGLLRSDKNIIIISDGTSENLNFLLASTTFARIFKEVDGVISRGDDQRRRLFDTHFQFTQDVYNISAGDKNSALISFKPRHPAVIKFTHHDLEKKAKTIIDQMEDAKKKGMTVIFYSGIIGSIPGKIEMAKKIMSVFINHLKQQLSMTFIINPSDYYESGMDADDLMYMWEIVQRSSLIDIWRFQTYDDIVKTFQAMDKKVPPEWVGKDATFSTGCTKEMKIALEVQQKYPEMQIMGPARERFLRRDKYGIGKMYDQRLSEICQQK